jgi:hypothetical protein
MKNWGCGGRKRASKRARGGVKLNECGARRTAAVQSVVRARRSASTRAFSWAVLFYFLFAISLFRISFFLFLFTFSFFILSVGVTLPMVSETFWFLKAQVWFW